VGKVFSNDKGLFFKPFLKSHRGLPFMHPGKGATWLPVKTAGKT